MIKNFNKYNLDKEINFLLTNSNESMFEFKNRLISIVGNLKSKLDIDDFIGRLTVYIKDRTLDFKKMVMTAFFFTLAFSSNYSAEEVNDMVRKNSKFADALAIDEDMKEALEKARLDTLFKEYEKRANVYLSKDKWKESKLSGKMFAEGAKQAYEKHGILVPVELALAQAQFESHFGTKGLSSKNNPFNVGEFDRGTMLTFDSPQEGMSAYFNLMAKDYLKDRTVDSLLRNFVNTNGNRYASNTNYEKDLKKQMSYTKRWIDKMIKNI